MKNLLGTYVGGVGFGLNAYLAGSRLAEGITQKQAALNSYLTSHPELTDRVLQEASQISDKVGGGNLAMGAFQAACAGICLGVALYSSNE